MSLPRQHFPEQPPDTKWFFPRVETTSNKQANSTEDPIMREWGLGGQSRSQPLGCPNIWFLPLLLLSVLLFLMCLSPLWSYSTSVMLMIVRGRGWNTSPAQPSQDCALPQEPLWPGIPVSVYCVQPLNFLPETGLQRDLQYRTPHSSSDQTPMSLMLFVHLSLRVCVSLSLFPAQHLPPVNHTREETMRTREG